MTTPSLTAVTGIKPTGSPHLGNYFGMIRPTLDLAADQEAYVFVADGHAMTTIEDPGELVDHTYEVAAGLLALGLDPDRTVLYRQTDVPEVFQLAWMLACSTAKGLLNRAHAYKAATDANGPVGRGPDEGVSAGLFTYPVLMAADILVMGGQLVPVGADQAQHLELTRDVASAFNRSFGAVLECPEPVIDPEVGVIPGTDGRKMAKSHDNVVGLFAPLSEVARRIRSLRTDSRRPEEPKDPASCPLYGLYRHLATEAAAVELADRYQAGAVGYAQVKEMTIAAFEDRFGAARDRYQELLADRAGLDGVLAGGAARARQKAGPVLAQVRRARGVASS